MIPHLAFPFTIVGPSAVVVEQDSLDEVAQSVQILLMTVRGSRVELLDFGIDDLSFVVDVPYDSITVAIQEWEPRAQAVFSDDPDMLDNLVRNVIARVSTQGGA